MVWNELTRVHVDKRLLDNPKCVVKVNKAEKECRENEIAQMWHFEDIRNEMFVSGRFFAKVYYHCRNFVKQRKNRDMLSLYSTSNFYFTAA